MRWLHHPPKLIHLCSVCLHQWRVPQFALKYSCNPPPQGHHLATIARYGGIFQGAGKQFWRHHFDLYIVEKLVLTDQCSSGASTRQY